MFFRRVFARKEPTANGIYPPDSAALPPIDAALSNSAFRGGGRTPLPHSQRRSSFSSSSDDNNKRVLSVLQLTPLWEHIIRTKSLPSNINESEMFEEFLERLRDPEWQVRQHALRVLVDVLIVMKQGSDTYFAPLIQPLVENLGHAAPAIRKGALDVLKVHMSETTRPDLAIRDIIEIGIAQPTGELQLGRLSVGVMLSLPSLLQTTLDTSHREHCFRMAIQALCSKMVQVTYQEVALKVLLRIRELIGFREFSDLIGQSALHEFEMLCNVYGLPRSETLGDVSTDLYISTSAGGMRTWKVLNNDGDSKKQPPIEKFWRSNSVTDDTDYDTTDTTDTTKVHGVKLSLLDGTNGNNPPQPPGKPPAPQNGSKSPAPIIQPNRHRLKPISDREANHLSCNPGDERVILETEINIENTSVTMRILEQSDDAHEIGYDEEDEDDDDQTKPDDDDIYEHTGIVRVLTDSELDEINQNTNHLYVSNPVNNNLLRSPRRVTFGGESVKMRTPDSESVSHSDVEHVDQPLLINIPSDNTQPLEREKSATIRPVRPSGRSESAGNKPISMSPVRRVRRLSMSPVSDAVTTLTPSHRSIEVLHNLQRSPLISPTRVSRRNSGADNALGDEMGEMVAPQVVRDVNDNKAVDRSEEIPNWEDLGFVDEKCLRNLESGDWRLRSLAVNTIEESLKQSDHMTLVQPCLESFLRMLLSSEKHPEVIEDKRRILTNLITRLPLDTLERRTTQIIIGLCRHGGAGSNRVAKTLMQRLLPTVVVHRLLSDEFLHARSTRFRENALQMVLFAMMTFPSTYFDIRACVERATRMATDRKRRVRQAALDVLAVLGQISSTKTVMDTIQQMAHHDVQIMQLSENGQYIGAAVKARLSRKQLPIVSPDGSVQYALRIPSSDGRQLVASNATTSQPHNVSPSSYLAGADIDWIVAGIGSVSPTSQKKRAHRMQMVAQQQQHGGSEQETNRAPVTTAGGAKSASAAQPMTTTKAPHEILAASVGVRPAVYVDPTYSEDTNYLNGTGDDKSMTAASTANRLTTGGGPANGVGSSSAIVEPNNIKDNSTNSSFVSNTNVNANQQRTNARFYSRSIPELSDDSGSSTSRLPKRVHPQPGHKPSRLPVTSRFPAMESHPDGRPDGNLPRQQHHHHHDAHRSGGYSAHQPQRFGNGSLSNLNRFTSQSQSKGGAARSGLTSNFPDYLIHQSSFEDERPIGSMARFTMDTTYQDQIHRRPTNAYTFFGADRNTYERQKPTSELSETTQTPQYHSVHKDATHDKSPRPHEPTPTIYRDADTISHHSLYDDVDHTQHMAAYLTDMNTAEAISDSGTNTGTTSEYSTDEICASATSTPTRRLVIDDGAGGDQPNLPYAATPIPGSPAVKPITRPLSQASQRSIQRRLSQQEDAQSSRSNLSHRSHTSSSLKRTPRETDSSSMHELKSLSAHTGSRVSLISVRSKSELSISGTPDNVSLNLSHENGPTDVPVPSETVYTGNPEDRPLSNSSHLRREESALLESPNKNPTPIPHKKLENTADFHDSTNLEDETQPDDEDMINMENASNDDCSDHESIEPAVEAPVVVPVYVPKPNRPAVLMRKNRSTLSRNGDETDVESKEPAVEAPVVGSVYVPKPNRPPVLMRKNRSILSRNGDESDDESKEPADEAPVVGSVYVPKPNRPPVLVRKNRSVPSKSCPVLATAHQAAKPSQKPNVSQKTKPSAPSQNIFPSTLRHFEKPRDALHQCLQYLESASWEETMTGLQYFVRLLRHHPDVVEPHLHVFCMALGKHIKNLRSQVSRASCQAAGELYEHKAKLLENETEEMALSLLNRTADTNKFLRCDAMRALESMCDHMPATKIFQMLTSRGATHQNAIVRSASADLCARTVNRVGFERVFAMNKDLRDRLIVTSANLLMEGSLETRNHAKAIFRMLSGHYTYERTLLEVIPQKTYRNIEKTLKNLRR